MPDYEAEVVEVDTGEPVETPAVDPQPEVEVEVETDVDTEVKTEAEPEKQSIKVEENLVELPDGRRLPPKEAEAEYRNLYSEFTRKSQKLASYEKGNSEINNNNQPTEKAEWVPESWEEVLERSKQALREDLENEKKAETESRQKIEDAVVGQLTDLKKDNPNLNESQLFNHAIKYHFTDLKLAYSNMKDMQSSIQKAAKLTADNIAKRNAEPISGGSQGGAVFDGDVYDPSARNTSLIDMLRSIKQ